MGYARKAVKGSAIVFVISILAAFIGYLIRMVLARNLSPAEYGLFFAVFTLINFTAIFKDMGLGSALIKYIPEFQVKGRLNLLKDAILTVLGFNLIFSIILAVVLVLLSKILAIYYFKNSLAVLMILFFVILSIVSIFKGILRSIFQAFQRMLPFSLMYLIENLLILISILIFFYFNKGVFSPIFAYITAYFLLFLIFLPFFFKTYSFFEYKFKFSFNLIKKLFRFGIPVMLASIGSVIILYTDTLILTYFRTLEEVGIYNVVVPTAMLLNFFSVTVSQVIFPMVSELWARKLKTYLNKGAFLLQKYSFVVIVPVALVMFSFPKILLRLFFGDAYVAGAITLQLLVIGLVFFVVAGINMTILSGIGKPQISTKILFIGALANFLSNFYFIPHYGMVGAAITSLISYFLIMILSIFYLVNHIKLNIPWSSWFKTFFVGIVFVLTIYLLKKFIEINAYLEAVICVTVAGIIYLGLAFFFKIIDIKEIKGLLIRQI